MKLDASNAAWRKNLEDTALNIGDLTHRFVLKRDFAKGLEAADRASAVAPDTIWLSSKRAHALMFLGREDEARAFYLKYRGTPKVKARDRGRISSSPTSPLSAAGLTRPLMDEIEKLFSKRRLASLRR